MGDISAEPSMEDILSSIKRIIAEDGDGGSAARQPRRSPRPSAPAAPPVAARERVADVADVLELSDPVVDDDQPTAPAPLADAAGQAEPILSDVAAQASRGALDALSRLVVKPAATTAAPPSPVGETLEGMVREMLRPMLREWLDAKLPGMVEEMVAKEIARITQGR